MPVGALQVCAPGEGGGCRYHLGAGLGVGGVGGCVAPEGGGGGRPLEVLPCRLSECAGWYCWTVVSPNCLIFKSFFKCCNLSPASPLDLCQWTGTRMGTCVLPVEHDVVLQPLRIANDVHRLLHQTIAQYHAGEAVALSHVIRNVGVGQAPGVRCHTRDRAVPRAIQKLAGGRLHRLDMPIVLKNSAVQACV